jgi:hypothetical protein
MKKQLKAGNPNLAEASKGTQFKSGVTLNPGGKPVGSRNALQGDFMRELAADFAEFGKIAISDTRANSPAQYLKIVASLMPKELEIKRPLEELTDDDIIAGVAALQSYIASSSYAGGAGNTTEPKQVTDLQGLH